MAFDFWTALNVLYLVNHWLFLSQGPTWNERQLFLNEQNITEAKSGFEFLSYSLGRTEISLSKFLT